jgi:hypothetical protein
MPFKALLISVLWAFCCQLATAQFGTHYIISQDRLDAAEFVLQHDGQVKRLCGSRKAVINLTSGELRVDFWEIDNNVNCPDGFNARTDATSGAPRLK